jgi:hypothetical protein
VAQSVRVIGFHRSCPTNQRKNEGGKAVHAREVVLIEQDIIVRRLACAEYPLMAAQIKVPLDRARHDRIDDDVPGGQFGLRGGWPPSATEASGKKTDLCFLPTMMSVIVGLKFSCAQASAWAGVRWTCVQGNGNACVLRMLGSSSPRVASNSPSETPSTHDRFSPSKKRRTTHRDRTRCVWGVCPSPLCSVLNRCWSFSGHQSRL